MALFSTVIEMFANKYHDEISAHVKMQMCRDCAVHISSLTFEEPKCTKKYTISAYTNAVYELVYDNLDLLEKYAGVFGVIPSDDILNDALYTYLANDHDNYPRLKKIVDKFQYKPDIIQPTDIFDDDDSDRDELTIDDPNTYTLNTGFMRLDKLVFYGVISDKTATNCKNDVNIRRFACAVKDSLEKLYSNDFPYEECVKRLHMVEQKIKEFRNTNNL